VIKAPNDVALLTNMALNIRVRMETKHGATLLPLQAIQHGAQGAFVYLVPVNKRVTVRTVTTGVVDRGVVEIQSGVAPWDTVVLDSISQMKEGIEVRCSLPKRRSGGAAAAPGLPKVPSREAVPTPRALAGDLGR
jgi:multidrug efflux system membrane fusion protein